MATATFRGKEIPRDCSLFTAKGSRLSQDTHTLAIFDSSGGIFRGSTLPEYYCAALYMSEGTGLGTRHFFERGNGALGEGHIGFAERAVDLVGARGGFEAVCEQETLEGYAGGPGGFKGHDVFGV